jgi:hypothetical protein
MEIVNEWNAEASCFCYNSNDAMKLVALASGDLSPNGWRFAYDPPQNATGRYYVKLTVKGGGGLAIPGPSPRGTFGGAELAPSGTIVLRGSGRPYQVVVEG